MKSAAEAEVGGLGGQVPNRSELTGAGMHIRARLHRAKHTGHVC